MIPSKYLIALLATIVSLVAILGIFNNGEGSLKSALRPFAQNLGIESNPASPKPFASLPPQLQPIPSEFPGNPSTNNPFAPGTVPPIANPNPFQSPELPREEAPLSPSQMAMDCWVTARLLERGDKSLLVVETNVVTPDEYLWGKTTGLKIEKRFGFQTTGRQSVYTDLVADSADKDVSVELFSDPSLSDKKLLCRSSK